jgi:fructokinase
MDLVCLGELLIDLFPAETGRRLVEVSAFHPKPGGAPGNVAVAARRLGLTSAFIGKVGNDAFGRFLIDTLAAEGVETSAIRIDDEARTTLAFIALPDPHHAEFVFYRNPGADTRLRADELDEALLRRARALHVGSLSLVAEPSRAATFRAVELARAAGALVSFDVNYRPSLWPGPAAAMATIRELLPLADVVKVNDDELRLLTGTGDPEAGGAALLATGPALVVVTLGSRGSAYRSATAAGFVPAFPVETVDAIGCGDAFMAGVLAGLLGADGDSWRAKLDGDHLRPILRYANAVGALTATREGALPALPTVAEVEAFLVASGEWRVTSDEWRVASGE